jgi:murein DD-endopeptidase MepM/ murein hydrolase activator NlpD
MAGKRTKYFYNPKTLSFEKVSEHKSYVRWRFFGTTSLFLVTVVGLSFLLSYFYVNYSLLPSQQNTGAVLRELRNSQRQIQALEERLLNLEDKDVSIYRGIFNVEPPKPIDLRGKDYSELAKLPYGSLVVRIQQKLDSLNALSDKQEKSYQKLEKLAQNRIKAIDAIPAIMPIANKDLKRWASGYGYRLDPFYHTPSFHPGMDFTAEVGTEVYATAAGTVQVTKSEAWSYGNHVIIDHGYGYTTLYGHLSRFAVRPGQKVTRGQLVGYVGNTGRSTGPHLHYEVRKYKNPLNPAFFYRNDLTDEQYQRMIELSQREATRFD